jgi:hypothetical protein
MEPESPSPYPQVPATCPYPEPTPSSLHDPLQLQYEIITLSNCDELCEHCEIFIKKNPTKCNNVSKFYYSIFI